MGLITTTDIPSGKLFGPIPATMTLTDPAYLIGHMTSDKYPDVPMTKVDLNTLDEPSRIMEWLPFIYPARNETEQNVEVYSSEGQIFYRTTRTILVSEEILAWYNRQFALIIGIPEVQPFYIKDGGVLTCPMCEATFRFPNSLRCHMRFKCDYKRKNQSMERLNFFPYDPAMKSAALSTLSYEYFANNYEKLARSIESHQRSHHIASDVQYLEGERKKTPSPRANKNSVHSISSLLDGKRKADSDTEPPPSPKRRPEIDNEYIDVEADDLSQKSNDKFIMDKNQNVKNVFNHEEQEGGSAFKKVEKSSPRKSTSPINMSSSASSSFSGLSPPLPLPSMVPSTSSPTRLSESTMAPFSPPAAYIPRIPVFPTNGLPRQYLSPGGFNENYPLNLSDSHRSSELSRTSEKMNLSQTVLGMQSKMPLMHDGSRMPYGSIPMPFKTHNPFVTKIMNGASPAMLPGSVPNSLNLNMNLNMLNLAQNWCAKCNATFRMTSDLVYHMRSHHKREFDPMKRKREEKLKCSVCNESFRERHHLTRHMTSHL